MELPPYVRPAADGCEVLVFVQPGAARPGLVGPHGAALRLRVRARPERGEANRATEELVADLVGVPRFRVTVIAGARSRHKTVALASTPPEAVTNAVNGVLSSRTHESGP